MKDFLKRLVSGLIGIVLLFFIVIKGNNWLYISTSILSLIGLREIFHAFKNINIRPLEPIGYAIAIGISLTNFYTNLSISFIMTLGIILILLHLVLFKNVDIASASITVLSVIYIPYLLNHINYLNDNKYIWFIFIIAFATDTFAYTVGNLFGKNKLAPEISPNKTVEGFLGGILGSLVASLAYAIYLGINSLGHIIVLSILGSVVSQAGDLVASRIKRITGIKDFGFIMPGHGGVLDRFDSIIFSSPIIYYYISYFII